MLWQLKFVVFIEFVNGLISEVVYFHHEWQHISVSVVFLDHQIVLLEDLISVGS